MRNYINCLYVVILANIVGRVVSLAECDAGWTLGSKTFIYCYRVSSIRMTYADAASECQKFDATLLRVYDSPTWLDVQTITNSTPDTRWWTSLNDQGTVGSWVFGTGNNKVSPNMDMIVFLTEPDDTNQAENCGALNYQGSVSDERCSDNRRYICEYTPPAGKPCQQSWTNYTTGCYLFPTGPPEQYTMLSWSAAKQKCQVALAGTSDSSIQPHLLFIETQDELVDINKWFLINGNYDIRATEDNVRELGECIRNPLSQPPFNCCVTGPCWKFIRSFLPGIAMTSEIWWIGLTDAGSEGHFTWSDGTLVNSQLLVWATEPNNLGGAERCGYINRVGLYGDLSCGSKEGYICQKETPDTNEFPALGCPGSWLRAGQSCYLLEYVNTKAWQDARTACQQTGASLININNPDEKMWLEDQSFVFENSKYFWTGLNNLASNTQWKWSDGSQANLSLITWNTEPNNYKGNEDCGTLNRKGYINDMDCLSSEPGFICEMSEEDQPCPAGWASYNDGDKLNCYYISNTTADVDEAHSQCNHFAFPGNAYLTAFNNKQELAFLQQQIKAQPAGKIWEWWTGLTDRGHEGFWFYDTSFNPTPDASLLPWGSFPSYEDGSEHCVAIVLGAQYINMKCTRQLPYICEKPAYGVSSRGSRMVNTKFSMSSVFVLVMYFLVYGICLHYILHLTYVLSPSYAYL